MGIPVCMTNIVERYIKKKMTSGGRAIRGGGDAKKNPQNSITPFMDHPELSFESEFSQMKTAR